MLRRSLIVISYALLGVAIIATTIILVAVGEGYSYDIRTNQFVLNGLLVLTTAPVTGSVYINGVAVHRQTPYRVTLQAGAYDLEIRHDGYHTWQKHIVITPSEVTDLSQILLVPSELKSVQATNSQDVSGVFPSIDHKHYAYITTGSDAGVWVENVDKRQGTKIYTPAPASADRAAEVLTNASWSSDNSHLLVATKVGDAVHYDMVSADGNTHVDLTDEFKFSFTDLQFSSYDWHELFWLSADGLRKLDTESKTISAPLASNVAAFTFAGDRVVYVQSTTLGKAVYSMDKNGNSPKRLVESLPESDQYELTYGSYRGRDLLAVIPRQTMTATLYLGIYGSTPTSVVVSKTASHLIFSPDARYLAFYSETGFGSYDVEQGQVSLSAHNLGPLNSLMWLDVYHVVLNLHDQAAVAEADGDNVTTFASVVPGTAVYASGDGKHILSFQNTNAATNQLLVTDLRP